MTSSTDHCQYYYADLAIQTSQDTRTALPLRRYWWRLKTIVWYSSIIGPRKYIQTYFPSTRLGRLAFKNRRRTRPKINTEDLGLKPGDWVEVRPAKEVFSTLDQHGKLKGLSFTPEMAKFCGKRFKVYKKLENIILESTGELRRIKSPTVLLDGVYCDGAAHGECDRSCFCFWREDWLRRIVPG